MNNDFIPASEIPVADLLITHADYDPEQITRFGDFYEGGARFEKNKDKYLSKRAVENSSSTGGNAFRQARLQSAHYTPHVAGIIDWLVSACMQSQPSILATGPAEKIAYYNNLNIASDGSQDLVALVMSRLLESMVQFRSYFSIDFPEPQIDPNTGLPVVYPSLGHQKAAGALDAQICSLDAKDVDDWEETEDKCLLWVRTHCVYFVRSRPFGPRDVEQHIWTFITNTGCFSYSAEKKVSEKTWPDKVIAKRMASRPHTLNALPVIKIKIPAGLWLMQRLFPLAKGLFNREASEDFALDSSALALPVITSDQDIKEVVANELACIKLRQGDDFKFATPGTGHFDALRNNATSKRENLYLSVQSASQLAGGKPDSGRASGIAKKYDSQQVACLLSSFAMAARDGLEKVLQSILIARGDEKDVKLQLLGLDKFDVVALESQLAQLLSFLAVPSPDAARRHVIEKTSLNICADAPIDTRLLIHEQMKSLDVSQLLAPPAPLRAIDNSAARGVINDV